MLELLYMGTPGCGTAMDNVCRCISVRPFPYRHLSLHTNNFRRVKRIVRFGAKT